MVAQPIYSIPKLSTHIFQLYKCGSHRHIRPKKAAMAIYIYCHFREREVCAAVIEGCAVAALVKSCVDVNKDRN